MQENKLDLACRSKMIIEVIKFFTKSVLKIIFKLTGMQKVYIITFPFFFVLIKLITISSKKTYRFFVSSSA